MKFYEFKACFDEETQKQIAENYETDDSGKKRGYAGRLRHICYNKFKEDEYEEGFVFLSDIADGSCRGGMISPNSISPEERLAQILSLCKLSIKEETLSVTECSSNTLAILLDRGRENSFVPDRIEDVIDAFYPLDSVFSMRDMGILNHEHYYDENMLKRLDSREELERQARRIFWGEPLGQELDRIFCQPQLSGVKGIPVHYLLCGDDLEKREKATEILISALYQNGRIEQKRYCELFLSSLDFGDARKLLPLYDIYEGGTVVIRFRARSGEDEDAADASMAVIDRLCRSIVRNKNKVQTILCFPLACEREKELIFGRLTDISFVTLCEQGVGAEQAREYLSERAEEDMYTVKDGLAQRVEEDRIYRPRELDEIYEKWSQSYMKERVYPQYSAVLSVDSEIGKLSPKGSAYDRLMAMIGLEKAKSVIDDAINYYKARKLMDSRGFSAERASMHMVFSGNPGTAKTTVARLFAEIMRDNEILSHGQLIEVGRGDLVGKYVGWTAQTVKDRFEEAKGGVLFIDEAYSLVDDRSGSFGDEAINTIVQEMENNRKDIIVIFAGYPDKMNGFLDKNPGLRSRIAFHIGFEDYNTEELCRMTELLSKDRGLRLEEGVTDKLRGIYGRASGSTDFGNGRFVRNLIEKASMRQATRLMRRGGSISDSELMTLTAEDFEYESPAQTERKRIGF